MMERTHVLGGRAPGLSRGEPMSCRIRKISTVLVALLLVAQPCLAQAPAPAASSQEVETTFWNTVKDSGDPAMLEAYLDRYPSGAFVPLARIMLDKLKKSGGAEPAPAAQNERPAAGAQPVPALEGGAIGIGSLALSPMSPELRAKYSIEASATGTVITGVADGSTAQERGLKAGDTIVEIMGLAITSAAEARDQIETARNQDKRSILLTIAKPSSSERRYVTLPSDDLAGEFRGVIGTPVQRENSKSSATPPAPSSQAEVRAVRHTKRVTLGKFPNDTIPRGWLGVLISDLPESLAKALELDVAKGVLANDVTEKGPAQVAGFRAGDIILILEGRELKDASDLARQISEKSPNSEVSIALARVGEGAVDLKQLMRQRAETGDANAQTALGFILEFGVGGAKDQSEAAKLYTSAAQSNHAEAMLRLAQLFLAGTGVAKDNAEAARLFRRAAEAGNVFAMSHLANSYRDGRGVSKDSVEAARWFRRAAELGDEVAMLELGGRYRDGDGVAKDKAEAVRWLQKSADAGNARAMALLATAYESGDGVAQDEVAAARWYRRSAEKDDVFGMLYLSIALRSGKGVAKDEIAAGATIKAALRQGDPQLVEYLMTKQTELPLDYRKWLQVQLSDLGAYNGAIDGKFGESMRKALQDVGAKH